jgi:hypothetical protein
MKPQSEWAFALWNGRPAIWSEVAAFSFDQGEWSPASIDKVGVEGRSSNAAALEAAFGTLVNTPPFPAADVAAAYGVEERRLRQHATSRQP